MNNIPTPRTNGQTYDPASHAGGWRSFNPDGACVDADFARQLERELDAAKRDANQWETQCKVARIQRDRLAEAGKILAEEYEDRRAQWGSEYLWEKHEDTELVNAALAAVKGEP